MQQFEQSPFASPFYPPGYSYSSPPPGMHSRSNFYQEGFGASIPTPAPSPRTPSSSRRRSSQHPEFMGSSEYVSGKRPSSSRRAGHEHAEFSHEQYSTASPRPGVQYRGAHFMHTPVHTPPPSSHAHHNMPNLYSYVPGGFTQQQPEYVSRSEFPHFRYSRRSPSPYYPDPSYPHHYTRDSTPLKEFRRHRTTSRREAGRHSSRSYKNDHNTYSGTNGYSYDEQFPAPTPGPQSPPPRERTRSRTHTHRREATWSGEPSPRSPPKPTKPSRANTDPAATDADAIRRKAAALGIPADYSLKNWDPNERPVILLGSVFDANSLGEWIFNWTKYHHGRSHDATKTAGGLWGLLIELSSKLKRARDFYHQIKTKENREILDDFTESGDRLWSKLKDLLKACEEYMWRGARGVASPRPEEGKTVQMGKKSGAEFVDAMFNGVKEWERTERLMRGMATWCQRFEVNCEDILRCPDA